MGAPGNSGNQSVSHGGRTPSVCFAVPRGGRRHHAARRLAPAGWRYDAGSARAASGELGKLDASPGRTPSIGAGRFATAGWWRGSAGDQWRKLQSVSPTGSGRPWGCHAARDAKSAWWSSRGRGSGARSASRRARRAWLQAGALVCRGASPPERRGRDFIATAAVVMPATPSRCRCCCTRRPRARAMIAGAAARTGCAVMDAPPACASPATDRCRPRPPSAAPAELLRLRDRARRHRADPRGSSSCTLRADGPRSRPEHASPGAPRGTISALSPACSRPTCRDLRTVPKRTAPSCTLPGSGRRRRTPNGARGDNRADPRTRRRSDHADHGGGARSWRARSQQPVGRTASSLSAPERTPPRWSIRPGSALARRRADGAGCGHRPSVPIGRGTTRGAAARAGSAGSPAPRHNAAPPDAIEAPCRVERGDDVRRCRGRRSRSPSRPSSASRSRPARDCRGSADDAQLRTPDHR